MEGITKTTVLAEVVLSNIAFSAPNAFLRAFLNILCKFEITVYYTRHAPRVLTSENRFLSLFYVSPIVYTHTYT